MKHFARNSFELIRHLLASVLAALIALGPAQLAFAGPHGFNPGKSGATIAQDGNTTVVTAPNKSIIHWQSFNVGRDEVVRFDNNTDVGMIRVLNRIDKSAPTRINGAITQQAGKTFMIYIVNPAGVFFGSDAQINVTGLQAVAGNLSDGDFNRGTDHFTNLKGKVENAARPSAENPNAGIVANAVSLVGRSVANSGTIDADSWIVMAAGRDVFIGKDPNGNGGLLLRVEGGADAIFKKAAVGVTNTGELIADGVPTPDQPKLVPRISLGAGDLYGTAIFNTGAIKAREVALRASNKGDVALAGEVRADTLNVTFAGDKSGKLVGANDDPEHVLNANTINLRAVGEKGQVVVDDSFFLRNQAGNDNTVHLNVEQRAVMETSNLAKLGLGLPGDRKDTQVALKSAQGIDMDDKALVRGTQLTLDAPGVLIHGDRDPLVVERLALQARLTRSESDLVVLGEDTPVESNDANGVALPTTWDPALRIGGNLELTTKPRSSGTEQRPTLIEAKQGTIATVGDIVTSDGGPLSIEAADVKLGVVSADGADLSGGSVLTSGTVPSSLTIVANNAGLDSHLKGEVTAKSLITRAAVLAPGVEQTKGGNVDVSAVGDLHLFGDILTEGGAGLRATDPRKDGGSVHLTSGGKLTVANITTGGADEHGPGTAEAGAILLHGDELVLNGNLNALAGSIKNESGQRNRSIQLEGPLTLGSDNPSIGGGDVTVKGKITEGLKREDAADPNSALIKRDSELFFDTGALRLEGGADLESLSIVTHGEPLVLFGGDVTAREFVDVGFSTNGVGHWGTTGSDLVKVTADLISVSTEPSLAGGSIEFGDKLRFKLTTPDDSPTDPDNPRPTFSLFQTSAIDEDTTKNLFDVPGGRFVDGVGQSTLRFTTTAGIQFAESALSAVKGSDLQLFGESFSVGAHSAPRFVFDVDSFLLTTQRALTVDFDVIARGTRDIPKKPEDRDQGIGIQSGAGGTGDLVVNGKLQSRAILLVAGDGIATTNPDGTEVGAGVDAKVTIGSGASFSNTADTAAPVIFGIAQDAALSSTALPSPSQFRGGSIDNMVCRLESFEGAVNLDSAHAEQYTGTKLELKGATIDLGDQALALSGLNAKSRGGLDVDHAITVSDPNGAIDLTAGDLTGVGDLTVTAPLTADFIDLRAGKLDGTATASQVQLELPAGAKFAGSGSDPNNPNPKHFGLTQDASLDSRDLPTRTDFADSNIDNMSLALRSKGGSLTFADTNLISHTALTLEAGPGGITIPLAGGELDLLSLDAKGAMKLDGDLATARELKIDGSVTLNAVANGSPDQVQIIGAGGDLTITGATAKTTGGNIGIGRIAAGGGDIALGDVTTAHTGGSIVINGNGAVKTGVLDASGERPVPQAGEPVRVAVKVTGSDSVEIAGIKAQGAVGDAGQTGGLGGNVQVVGASLKLGTIDASGGRGGSPNRDHDSTSGGDAGFISLAAVGTTPTIGILGDLLAVGGAGATSDQDIPLGPLRGTGNTVTVTGDLLLLANREIGSGATNTIRGTVVGITGNVKPGTEKLTEDADETPIPPSSTGLTVVADDSLTIGGTAITAGRLDLEVHHGNLDLGQKTIHSDTIRLAASNGADSDPNGTGEVDLSGLDFMGANGTRRIVSLTVEQDKGFGGPNGSDIPDVNDFKGTAEEKEVARSLALISQDGAIVLDQADFDKVEGTRLTLAANKPISINGDELALQRLQLGSVVGVGLSKVGGDATVNGDLALTGIGLDDETLRAYGNLTVTGDATVIGRSTFSSEIQGHENQRFDVTGELEFGGSELGKTTTGSLNLTAGNGITLEAPIAQTISNGGGQLVIGAPLKKGEFANDKDGNPVPVPELIDPTKPSLGFAVGQRGLSLIGVSSSSGQPAIVVTGTQQIAPGSREYAIAVANGDLLISASSGSGANRTGSYQLGGDVLAFGDVNLSGEGTFKGGAQPQYTVEALRNPLELAGLLSGELTMGGVASADHDLRLVATGDNPSEELEHPAGIHLLGNFTNLNGALEVDGDVDFKDDTTIAAAGDVAFDRRVQGEKGLSVTSDGQVVLGDDVAMSAGALSLSGDGGVRFASTSDTQFVQAGSISLGAGAARAPSGVATLVRDGNLSLKATGGDVAVAKGQRLVVNGSLDVSAPRRIALTDTAALRISLVSHDLIVSSGASVVANSIVTAARPQVTGDGLATFAVPTRTELSDNIPIDDILVRQINADGSPLSLSGAFETFPTVPFPEVNGPAQFDYARQTPPPPVRLPLSRPHVDEAELDASLADRPLWAEELLAYLEERSLETPGVSAAVEHLPPVGARPGDPITPEDQRVRSAAAEQAVTLYREVFRPKVARDPETGFIDGPGRAAAIRAAFQAPIDVLRRENGGRPVSGSALRELISSNPSFASAASYGSQIDQLLAAGELALTPDQKPRFRALLLSEVTPYGIAPAEFETAIQ